MSSYSSSRGSSAARLSACVVAVVLAVSGCGPAGSSDKLRDSTAALAMDAEWQAREFASYYEQDIEWFECGADEGLDDGTARAIEDVGVDLAGVGCAYIAAPFDWEQPAQNERIDLHIVHIPSTGQGEPLGTLLLNPGGPGETGANFAFGMTWSPGFEDILEHYDVLGFDPRGIGGSSPIDCEGDESNTHADQLSACIAENPLTQTMGTSQVARDMELMRALMGDTQLNFLGYSYGSMLGATYASLFPEHVGRMMLDSAENAEWATPIHLFDQTVAQSNALIRLAASCTTKYAATVENCPFVDEETLLDAMAQLDESPLLTSANQEITGTVIRDYLIDALYQSSERQGTALDTIARALGGDQIAIDDIGTVLEGSGVHFELDIVLCHSFPSDPDISELTDHISAVGIPRLFGGPDITDESLASFLDLSCAVVPKSAHEYTESFEASDASPILIIAVTGDHATPYQYALELADELGNARVLTLEGSGHAVSYSGVSTCIDSAATAYFLRGELPEDGAICAHD